MAAVLTYHLHQGILTGTASGRHFQLLTYREQSRIAAWLKQLEKTIPDSVSAGRIGHKLKVGSNSSLELYDYPEGEVTKRKVSQGNLTRHPAGNHSYTGPMLFIKERNGGFYIHGYPPCNIRKCIVLAQPWNELRQAIAGETELSLYIEY